MSVPMTNIERTAPNLGSYPEENDNVNAMYSQLQSAESVLFEEHNFLACLIQ